MATGDTNNTCSDYRRALERYVCPFFGRGPVGDVDIAMIMTRPVPTRDGVNWPWPTIAVWKRRLGEQPRHDRHGEPIVGTRLQDKTRRNIESRAKPAGAADFDRVRAEAIRTGAIELRGRRRSHSPNIEVPEAW